MEHTIIISTFSMALIGLAFLKSGSKKRDAHSPYVDAIHLMLEGKNIEALEKLKKTVKIDTENIMAYIQLGVIFRETGYPVRAAKVHRNLLVRGDLSDVERISILRHLVLDYKDSGAIDLAIETAERLAQGNKKDVEAKELLLSLYEEKGDWDKAFFYRQAINKWLKRKDSSILALYKVMSGLKQIEDGTEKEGRIRFREAVKLDKNCVPAFLYWGDSYKRDSRPEDALKTWTELTQKNPDFAHLTFDRLKDILYELGRYGEMEQIYNQVSRKKPKTPAASIQLIVLLQKQGNIDQAMDLAEQVLDQYPDSAECYAKQIQLLSKKGEFKEAAGLAEKVLSKLLKQSAFYHCSKCDYETSDPLWHCPSCHSWNSFLTD